MVDGMDKAYALRHHNSRACARCQSTPPLWGDARRHCAFVRPQFSDDNWNCATMNQLRQLVELEGLRVYGEDESLGMIRCPEKVGGFLVLSWYKEVGRTSVAQHVSSCGAQVLTFDVADAVLRGLYTP